jgi:choline transport protein
MAIAYSAVVYGSKALPYWQNAVFVVHILGFFAYLVPIWVNAPTASHREVWLSFENFGGWSSLGLAALVGQLTGISGFSGLDAVSLPLLSQVHAKGDGCTS